MAMNIQHDTPSEDGQNNYLGNRWLARNRCAPITNDQNCRLWIERLPPDCTYQNLLSSIRDVGPIYATHIVPPMAEITDVGVHPIPTSAASVTFFSHHDANLFLAKHAASQFTVNGYRATILRHRVRTVSVDVNGQSRVLIIRGHPYCVDPQWLTWLFTEKFKVHYDTDYLVYTPGRVTSEVIWAFGSFRAQAHTIYNRLTQQLSNSMTVTYGTDPCGGGNGT
ncbi:uncharacterized protein F4817DRAFT_315910 [Daldinia loculata]|uniref:uncharacterized protein n=1 Tax=Daldinia loculata TaxID=103429 RepID=UPI0020C2D661|nr:uncharacterized protein F4817DRAFT_315910 [Daldinia loculata]KAI1647441.1 hypothetical protein F4817DRAFT_315910 [Daldinia loculata]